MTQARPIFDGGRLSIADSTSTSNLLEPHHCRDTKKCRVLLHEFGVVRVYRTFSTRRSKVYRCLCTSSGWFKHIEPPRFSNHIIARCVQFYYMSSGWFDCTEPSLPGDALVRGGSSTSNLLGPSLTTSLKSNLLPHHCRDTKECRVLLHEFGVVRLYRTFSTRRSKVYRVLMH